MSINKGIPYNDLPKLTDIDFESILDSEVYLTCTEARIKLDRFSSYFETMESKDLLEGSLLLLEAKLSSETESIITTISELFKSENEQFKVRNHNTTQVYRNKSAIIVGNDQLEIKGFIDNAIARKVCSRIKNTEMAFRTTEINLENETERSVVYTPPLGEDLINKLMHDWENFINNYKGTVDPLIIMAVQHYQFVAIHPFEDGNGRTGRVLNLLVLLDNNLITKPVLHLSYYILKKKSRYYKLLAEVTEQGNWKDWILFMLDSVVYSADQSLKRLKKVESLYLSQKQAMESHTQLRKYSDMIIKKIYSNPYCTTSSFIGEGNKNPGGSAVAGIIRNLLKLGIIKNSGKREGYSKLYCNQKLLDLIEE